MELSNNTNSCLTKGIRQHDTSHFSMVSKISLHFRVIFVSVIFSLWQLHTFNWRINLNVYIIHYICIFFTTALKVKVK